MHQLRTLGGVDLRDAEGSEVKGDDIVSVRGEEEVGRWGREGLRLAGVNPSVTLHP